MKHLLIIELSYTGHFSIYLERIVSAFINSGCLVTVVVRQEFEEHKLTAELKARFKKKIRFRIIKDDDFTTSIRTLGGNSGSEMANWLLFRNQFIDANFEDQIDFVFIPYVDYCINMIGLLGSPFGHTRWGGICMLTSIHHGSYKFLKSTTKSNWIKRFAFFRLLNIKSLNTLFTIDELLLKYVVEKEPRLKNRIQYLKDPAELKGEYTRTAARKFLNISEEATIILVFGAINSRKGLNTLIKALNFPDVPKSTQIVIVGQQDQSINYLYKSKEKDDLLKDGRLHVINRFVDDAVQQIVFVAADIVWLGYKNHFSMSGVLALAAIARRVVISTEDGLIGWHTREKSLGITVDVGDLVNVKNAIIELSDTSNRQNYQTKMASVFDEHTWDRATQQILDASEFF